jgi:hypothetical protein
MTVTGALLTAVFAIAFAAVITVSLPIPVALLLVFSLVLGASLGAWPGLLAALALCLVAGTAWIWLKRRAP